MTNIPKYLKKITLTKAKAKNCFIAASGLAGGVGLAYIVTVGGPALIIKTVATATTAAMKSTPLIGSYIPTCLANQMGTVAGGEAYVAMQGFGFGWNFHTASIAGGIGAKIGKDIAKNGLKVGKTFSDYLLPSTPGSKPCREYELQTKTIGNEEYEMINPIPKYFISEEVKTPSGDEFVMLTEREELPEKKKSFVDQLFNAKLLKERSHSLVGQL